MGPEVEYFPNVSAICGTLQLNAIIAVLGSECQRTGRDGVTNSRLTGGVSAAPPAPAWEVNLAGEGSRPSLGSADVDHGPRKDTPWAREGPCVVCACAQVGTPVPAFLCYIPLSFFGCTV